MKFVTCTAPFRLTSYRQDWTGDIGVQGEIDRVRGLMVAVIGAIDSHSTSR